MLALRISGYFLVPSMAGSAFILMVYGIEKWWAQRALRQEIIDEFGEDVDVEGTLYVTRDGTLVDPAPTDGDQADRHLLYEQRWVDPEEEGGSFTPPVDN